MIPKDRNLFPPAIVQEDIEREKSVKRCNLIRKLMMRAYGKAFNKPLTDEERALLHAEKADIVAERVGKRVAD